jgi:predicted nucleic acid-binding protein
MKRVLVDTSCWIAYVNDADPDHGRVTEVIDARDVRLVTTNHVFDETVTLCLKRLGHEITAQIGDALLDPRKVDMVRVSAADEADAWRLLLGRQDKRYSFTDCTSFVLMRRLGIEEALTLDDHFRQEGFHTAP